MIQKTVIITGASSGIGEALAKEYAKKKFNLVLAARSIEKLEILAQSLQCDSFEILNVKTDVSKEEDCKNLIDKAIEKFGKIDILINNAGISMRAAFKDLDLNVIKNLMDVNYWGTVYCTKYAIPHLLETKGSVVGVSSIAGYVGLPGRTGYSSSKFAMQGFLEVIRIEHLKKGLHVLIACPGFTASNIRNVALTADGSKQGETPRDEQKMMSSEEVAKKIAKAVSKRKRTLIMTRQGKMTVFFSKILPKKVMDKLIYNNISKEPNSPFV